eukprot:Gregarina_sp_Pseudo_9__64@NODE_1042_length_1941_cov_172_603049_g934_i1_p1_GENE_NODE_1042_length_1941_cov_172_603049_g934_i1NODE_1042_length_1941_cov_172_603049_g934_i1_p1_ORF_typecomplete_len567_score67_47Mannitol_dh_C/PF08125_13/0_0061Mannitol_dh_C/PF08125_13/1_1e03_NODE_1042_length_1941_cov_172_603049_g934_i11041804
MQPVSMEAPIATWLDRPTFEAYRATYRRFREGQSRGAVGDASDGGLKAVCPEGVALDPAESLTRSSSFSDTSLETQTLDSADQQDARLLQVTEWRLRYRRFRMGNPRGSVGELTEVTPEGIDLGFLPVVQCLRLRRQALRLETPFPPTASATSFHVHLGGGKLGLGLVLKTLQASGQRFVLLQNARGLWLDLHKPAGVDTVTPGVDTVEVQYNDEAPITLGLIYQSPDSLEELQRLTSLSPLIRGWVVVTNSHETKRMLIKQATTLSISVGSAGVVTVGDLLDEVLDGNSGLEPTLFACENDHNAVSKLEARLKSKAHVIPCMVDRICSGLTISSCAPQRAIRVSTEAYRGEIVVLESFNGALPFGGSEVKNPSLEIQGNYFADRKFLLVNGGHTTLAFLTMLRYHDQDSAFAPPGCDALLDWGTCTVEERTVFWSFTVARLLLLLWQYDIEVLKDAHRVESDEALATALISYAKETLIRFSAIPDTTNRVLSGGVENRYQGRLRNVQDFIDLHFDGLNQTSRKLLEMCGCRLSSLIAVTHKFVSQCKQFVRDAESMDITLPDLFI